MKNILIAATTICLIFVPTSSELTVDNISRFSSRATSCDPDVDCSTTTAGSFVVDPLDCHNYYFCITSNGNVVASDSPLTCPSEEFFNSTTLECETETTACVNVCDTDCSVTCSESGVQIPDPFDCRMFYICLEVGDPGENVHFSCDTDQIFDPDSGVCVAGTSCTPTCSTGTNCVSADNYTCTTTGNFPRCESCDNSYITCSEMGIPTIAYCGSNSVFNTNTEYPYCVLPENCPFPAE